MGGFIGYQNQTPGYYGIGAQQSQQLIDQQNAQRAQIAAQNKARSDALRKKIEDLDEERKNWSREDYEKHLDFTHKSILSDQEAGQNLTLQQDQQGAQQQLGQQRFGQEMQLGDIQNQQQVARDFRLADISNYAENVKYAQETAMQGMRFEQQGALSEQSHQQNLETLGQQQDFQLGEHREDTANRFTELGLTHGWQQDQNRAQQEAEDRKVFDQQMAEGIRQGKLDYTDDDKRDIALERNAISKIQRSTDFTQAEKDTMVAQRLRNIRSKVAMPIPPKPALTMAEQIGQLGNTRDSFGNIWEPDPKTGRPRIKFGAHQIEGQAAKTVHDQKRLEWEMQQGGDKTLQAIESSENKMITERNLEKIRQEGLDWKKKYEEATGKRLTEGEQSRQQEHKAEFSQREEDKHVEGARSYFNSLVGKAGFDDTPETLAARRKTALTETIKQFKRDPFGNKYVLTRDQTPALDVRDVPQEKLKEIWDGQPKGTVFYDGKRFQVKEE